MTHAPITGFTLELDGTPAGVERVRAAIAEVIKEMYAESQDDVWAGHGPRFMAMRGLLPVHGTITFRPWPEQA